jgi:hypothetical protein
MNPYNLGNPRYTMDKERARRFMWEPEDLEIETDDEELAEELRRLGSRVKVRKKSDPPEQEINVMEKIIDELRGRVENIQKIIDSLSGYEDPKAKDLVLRLKEEMEEFRMKLDSVVE